MTATASKVSQRAPIISEQEWVKIFPKDVTENYLGSMAFMKQLTWLAVSQITYCKGVFPEENYSTETFAGIRLKLLNSTCSDMLAQFVSTALQQAWEAFDKKYVHQLALCFYENECLEQNLLEYYIFEYSHNADGASINIKSKGRSNEQRSMQVSLDRVKQRTLMFIRTLLWFISQNDLELPLNCDISLRLYYNDSTPEFYQAPGFLSNEGPDHLEATLPEALRLGSVPTPFHKVALASYKRGLIPASDEAVPSVNAPVITQGDNLDSGSSAADHSEGSVEIQMRCVCKRFDVPEDLASLITCQYCGTQQHAVCFGFLSRAPSRHCCHACFDEDPRRECTDPRLINYDDKRRVCLSICRRILKLCSQLATISAQMIMEKFGLSADAGRKMMKFLNAHNVVPYTAALDLSTPSKINHTRLNDAFKSCFQTEETEQDRMADRLMAETEANYNATDPFGEVLSPLETITLRNSSNLGQIIQNPTKATKRTGRDDKTLEKYREAVVVMADIADELPLSGSHNPVKDIENIGRKKSKKRKNDDDDDWVPKLTRSGAKTKKVRTST